jgi:hypothetical protein
MQGPWSEFLAALAAPAQPASAFAALQAIFRERVPARLFTVMAYDPATQMSKRIHTSHPAEYPLSGSKPLSVGKWSATVIEGKRCFVANTIEAIAEVFPDHELIRSLGCASVVNLPAVFAGGVIGSVNLLDAKDSYTPQRVEAIESLAPFALTALLAARAA